MKQLWVKSLLTMSITLSFGLTGQSAFAAKVSCASFKLQNDSFDVQKKPDEECHLLGAIFDLSSCPDNKPMHPAQISCHTGFYTASIQTKSTRYEVRLQRIVGEKGNVVWDTLGQIKETLFSPVAKISKKTSVLPVVVPDRQIASIPHSESSPEAEKKASKAEYTLFHPTPRDLMRDFNPDRPGSTNTPNTIDAGHYELEVELANYSRITTNGATTTQLNYPNPYLRIGVTNDSEIAIGWVPQKAQWINSADASSQTSSGMGDVSLFYKKNMLGNDGGAIAWAIMPGVKIPSNTNGMGNDKVEPSIKIPLSFSMPGDWGLSFMPEIDVKKDLDSDGFHTEFNSPVTLGHPLFANLSGYTELVTHSSSEDSSPLQVYCGAGVAMKVGENMQFDLENNFGLNAATPPVNIVAGWTIRY